MKNKTYICPVCGYDGLDEPPYSFCGAPTNDICSCCGFEYGYDDDFLNFTFDSYRKKWINDGAKWSYEKDKPKDWNLEKQLKNIEKIEPYADLPYQKVVYNRNGKVNAPAKYKGWVIRVESEYNKNETYSYHIHLSNMATSEKTDICYKDLHLLEEKWNFKVDWDKKLNGDNDQDPYHILVNFIKDQVADKNGKSNNEK